MAKKNKKIDNSKALVKAGNSKTSKKFNKKVKKLAKAGKQFEKALPEIRDNIHGRQLFDANEKALLGFCIIILETCAVYEKLNKKNPVHTDITAMRGLMECYIDIMNKVEMMHNSKFIVGHIIDNLVQKQLMEMAKSIGLGVSKTMGELIQDIPHSIFAPGGREQFVKMLTAKKAELVSGMGRIFDNGMYELKNQINLEVHQKENEIKNFKRKI